LGNSVENINRTEPMEESKSQENVANEEKPEVRMS
jgi:hypothetical protein